MSHELQRGLEALSASQERIAAGFVRLSGASTTFVEVASDINAAVADLASVVSEGRERLDDLLKRFADD